jgi:hypothetical protein
VRKLREAERLQAEGADVAVCRHLEISVQTCQRWRSQFKAMQLVTAGGRRIGYDFLVVAPGIQLDWDAIPGLATSVGGDNVCSIYSYETVERTWDVSALVSASVRCWEKCRWIPSRWWRRARFIVSAFVGEDDEDRAPVVFGADAADEPSLFHSARQHSPWLPSNTLHSRCQRLQAPSPALQARSRCLRAAVARQVAARAHPAAARPSG